MLEFVEQQAMVDFVESLGKVHDEGVSLLAILQVLSQFLNKLQELCLA